MFTTTTRTRLRREGDAVRGVSAMVTTHLVLAADGTVERSFYSAGPAARLADALNDCSVSA